MNLKYNVSGFSVMLFFLCFKVSSQDYSTWNGKQLILDNGIVKRTVSVSETGAVSSSSLMVKGYQKSLINSKCDEFSFILNDKPYNGLQDWKFINYNMAVEKFEGKGAKIRIRGTINEISNLELDISYILYPNLPVIRKKILFRNMGREDLKIEGLVTERITVPWGLTSVWTYNNFARQKWYGQLFTGNLNDPLVVVHNIEQKAGIALGNEAPGITKETTVLQKNGLITIGLTQPGETFSFRKWLRPGEEWESPWTFIIPYANSGEPYEVINGTVCDFVRKHMGIRIEEIPKKPCFVYNTWQPFRRNINDTLMIRLADAASECGIEEFVIDDGWQNNYGDWEIDSIKFPKGLKPVFDYIKSKGMKPGLWISLSAAQTDSKIYKKHPEWSVISSAGKPINLHSDFDNNYGFRTYTMSMGTDWLNYMRDKILYLVKEHGLEYVKADFGVVTGAYTYDKFRSGDHTKNNSLYRDREESLLVLYRRLWQLFDELHKEAPNLFIDCTFEAMGSLHLIDYDMCKHAEGDWLSNIEDPFPTGVLRVRQLAWARTPVIPATALVIGNLPLNGPDWESNLKSLTGTLPIVLGDLREIQPETRIKIREWADWMKKMQASYNFMMFRQDLPGSANHQRAPGMAGQGLILTRRPVE